LATLRAEIARWKPISYSEAQLDLTIDRCMEDFYNYQWCRDPIVLLFEEVRDIVKRRIPNLFRQVPVMRRERAF